MTPDDQNYQDYPDHQDYLEPYDPYYYPQPENFEQSTGRQWWYLLVVAGLIVVGGLIYLFWPKPHYKLVHNFDECVTADYPVTESDPEVCHTPYGKSFTQNTVASNVNHTPIVDIPFTILVTQTNGGPAKPENDILTSDGQWQAFWNKLYAGVTPFPSPMRVDFSQNEIVAVMGGQKATAGHQTEVSDVTSTNNHTTVVVVDAGPPPGCIAAATVMSPFEIITIPKTTQPISFTNGTGTTRAGCPVNTAAKSY